MLQVWDKREGFCGNLSETVPSVDANLLQLRNRRLIHVQALCVLKMPKVGMREWEKIE